MAFIGRFAASLLALSLACSTSSGGGTPFSGDGGTDGGSGADAKPTPPPAPRIEATLRGRVWAPNSAPGAENEIPVAGAIVYLSKEKVSEFPTGAYCETCRELPGGATQSDPAGHFELSVSTEGEQWLVIEKGQFRRQRKISVADKDDRELEAALTTLPSQHSPATGDELPSIALAMGRYDRLQSVFKAFGLVETDADGDDTFSLTPQLDLYSSDGTGPSSVPEFRNLLSDLNALKQYHILFVACGGSDVDITQEIAQNLRDYVAAGGKIYTTDWSSEWIDNVFPEQMQFSSSHDTPASAYDATSDTWDTSKFDDGDGSGADSDSTARVVDPTMAAWLSSQRGPQPNDGFSGVYDSSNFNVSGMFNKIERLNRVLVGNDGTADVYDEPTLWVDDLGSNGPLTVTFEPAGCGRVLYSTYHTADNAHDGLYPQERILLYLILEVGVCKAGPVLM